MFWLIGTAFALHNFLNLTKLGGFTRVFQENCGLLVFGGVWELGETPGSTRQKKFDPKKIKKKLKILMFPAVSENVFSSKTERFFRFQPLVPPIGP